MHKIDTTAVGPTDASRDAKERLAATKTEPALLGATRDNDKKLSTLKAQFALRGLSLRAIQKQGHTYLEVSRWSQSWPCSTLHDLKGFLAHIRVQEEGSRQ